MFIAQSLNLLGHEIKKQYLCVYNILEGIIEDAHESPPFCCCLQTKVGRVKSTQDNRQQRIRKSNVKSTQLHYPQTTHLAFQKYFSNSFTVSEAQGQIREQLLPSPTPKPLHSAQPRPRQFMCLGNIASPFQSIAGSYINAMK